MTSPEVELLEAVRSLAQVPWGEPGAALLPYWPVSAGNPYQRGLHDAMRSRGIVPVPCSQLSTVVGLARQVERSLPVVVHLHWLAPVLSRAQDEASARALADAFAGTLDELRSLGARLVWTVHNVLPHDARFPEVEARVHQDVADRADVVHVMDPGTVEACAPWYRIDPARVVEVPHPSYAGAYPPLPTRRAARTALGIPHDAHVLLVLGRLEPYKGLDELAAVVPRLEPDTLLVLAGPAEDDEQRERLEHLALRREVLLQAGPVDDARVPVLLAAADAMPLPYRRPLNSGALALAATAGLPVAVPRGMGAGWVTPAWAAEYDRHDPDGLAGALRELRTLARDPAARAAALQAAADHDPEQLAGRLADAVSGVVTAGSRT